MWSSSKTSLSRSNLGRNYFGYLGRGCWAPGMTIASTKSHGCLDSMLPSELKFIQGDGIESKGGLFSGGLVGPEKPGWVSQKSKNVESPFGKYKIFQN